MAGYCMKDEAARILDELPALFPADDQLSLPKHIFDRRESAVFKSAAQLPYFPIPLKEIETTAALKAIEGFFAAALADQREAGSDNGSHGRQRSVTIDLEKTTAFLFEAYMTTIGGYGKLDKEARSFLKDTDFLRAQSNPYRRMSANLYATRRPGEFYHIHGSLEASTTLRMIGLEPERPDLVDHDAIVETIEAAVARHTVDELEALNSKHGQAGVPALKFDDFRKTAHGQAALSQPPWTVSALETDSPPCPLPTPPPTTAEEGGSSSCPLLAGVRVLELCRVIAGPSIGRVLAEYGADVLKVTGPESPDVPFFQVDVNMGKRTTSLDLKGSAADRAAFEALLADVDVVLDGYRPGAIEKLGFGPRRLTELARRRGRGVVYVSENCFGYEGEWAHRPGWQQIADCVTGVAWEQGRFMGLDEPVVPPFPMSDYGTGCMGAIAALAGLHHRAARGGSYHGRVSLCQYDLLLLSQTVGRYPDAVLDHLRAVAGPDLLRMRHVHSVEQISGAALRGMRAACPDLFARPDLCETWLAAEGYGGAEVSVVGGVTDISRVHKRFRRACRPNGTDTPDWEGFGMPSRDRRLA